MQIPAALIGCEIWHVAFDYQTRPTLAGRNPDGSKRVPADLVSETPFTLTDGNGKFHALDPNTSSSALAPVIDLLLKTVTGVAVRHHGTLTLDFDDGAHLVPAARSLRIVAVVRRRYLRHPGRARRRHRLDHLTRVA